MWGYICSIVSADKYKQHEINNLIKFSNCNLLRQLKMNTLTTHVQREVTYPLPLKNKEIPQYLRHIAIISAPTARNYF